MSDEFQDITVIANPEQAQARDGSRRHAKKFPFRLSAAPTPRRVAIFNGEWSTRSTPNGAAVVHGDDCKRISADRSWRSPIPPFLGLP